MTFSFCRNILNFNCHYIYENIHKRKDRFSGQVIGVVGVVILRAYAGN